MINWTACIIAIAAWGCLRSITEIFRLEKEMHDNQRKALLEAKQILELLFVAKGIYVMRKEDGGKA